VDRTGHVAADAAGGILMALREVAALIGLGGLGGTWAVAWANRRAQLPERTAMLDARTQVQVRLDALRARTAALARRDLPDEARAFVDDVIEQEVLVDAILSRAATVADVTDVEAEIDDAFMSIDEAATLVGAHMPADAPFAGLCAVDPGHGLATSPVARDDDIVLVCDVCADDAAERALPPRRQVTILGRPVDFDDEQFERARLARGI
jgi:hypothetical protein